MEYTITVSAFSQRRRNPDKLASQLGHICKRVVEGGRDRRGWTAIYQEPVTPTETEEGWKYEVTLSLCNDSGRSTNDNDFRSISEIIVPAACTATKAGWSVSAINGLTPSERSENGRQTDTGESNLAVPDDWQTFFETIYGRQNQIDIVMSSVTAGIESSFNNRFHTVLYGPPACGKTGILRCLKSMFGEEHILEFDATSTTSAGAIKDLAGRDVLPRIMLIEELEKCDEISLRWLLGILDQRAEIRKVTARQTINKEVKLLCLATVNNMKLFKSLMSGALASRFTNELYCPRPDREILRRILLRELATIEGDESWIDPAITYAEDEGLNDPRRIISICLCGKEQLLDGSYQKKLRQCKPKVEIDMETLTEIIRSEPKPLR